MLDAGIDKRMLLTALIAQVEAKLAELRMGYGAARDAVLSTPHVMKGKREVFGQESAYLANALALNIQEREQELRTLRNLRLPMDSQRVAQGCAVGLGPMDGEPEEFYFLLPICGGMEVPAQGGGGIVRVITNGTPIAKALLGKTFGDEVTLPTAPPARMLLRSAARDTWAWAHSPVGRRSPDSTRPGDPIANDFPSADAD
jgi:transcription elongation GreA/GreB family factor